MFALSLPLSFSVYMYWIHTYILRWMLKYSYWKTKVTKMSKIWYQLVAKPWYFCLTWLRSRVTILGGGVSLRVSLDRRRAPQRAQRVILLGKNKTKKRTNQFSAAPRIADARKKIIDTIKDPWIIDYADAPLPPLLNRFAALTYGRAAISLQCCSRDTGSSASLFIRDKRYTRKILGEVVR